MLTSDAPMSIATQPRSLGFRPIFIASASTVLRVKPRSSEPVKPFFSSDINRRQVAGGRWQVTRNTSVTYNLKPAT